MSRLPSALKAMNTFVNGVSYVGDATEVTIPPLVMKTEEFNTGLGTVKIPMTLESIDFESTYMGMCPPEILNGFGSAGLGREMIRWVGGYQNQDTGANEAHEIVCVGSHLEIDQGAQKGGEKTETKVKHTCTYYKQSVNGQVRIEIDVLERIFLVNGVDRWAELRALMNG